MRNIELKARISDYDAAEEAARRLAGPAPCARMRQVDTYFHVPEGRLKLREIEGDGPRAELIFYRRPDGSGPKRCDYEIAPAAEPARTKSLLAASLGVRTVVDKRRTVYIWRNVRIHLDRVEGLGAFIEFEAVMPEGAPDSEGELLLCRLMGEFSLREEDLVGGSYCDLLHHKPR